MTDQPMTDQRMTEPDRPTPVAPRPMGECAVCGQPMDDPYDERHTLPSGHDVHPDCCPCRTGG